jgi:hypothetical protein
MLENRTPSKQETETSSTGQAPRVFWRALPCTSLPGANSTINPRVGEETPSPAIMDVAHQRATTWRFRSQSRTACGHSTLTIRHH